jgi:hypothetical protein
VLPRRGIEGLAPQEQEVAMGQRCEPSLDELFADLAVRQLMASDGVSEAGLRALLGTVRRPTRKPPRDSVPGVAECCFPGL